MRAVVSSWREEDAALKADCRYSVTFAVRSLVSDARAVVNEHQPRSACHEVAH